MEETSRYKTGDFVVYSYSGSYRKEPVRLTERVLSKEGDKLEIFVEWESGAKKRAWKQFLTDTKHNRDNNIVDRLVLVENGKERNLENRDNLDLFKLYEGTFLMPQRPPELLSSEKKTVKVAGAAFPCEVKTYKTHVLGRSARMTVIDSGEFLWTHVAAEYRSTPGGELIYLVKVEDFGLRR